MRRSASSVLVLAALVVPLAPPSAGHADAVAISGASTFDETFFAPPSAIRVSVAERDAVVPAAGSTSQAHLAVLDIAVGEHPDPSDLCLGGQEGTTTFSLDVTAAGQTLTFDYALAVQWICNRQMSFRLTLPAGQSLVLPDGDTLTVTPFNNDPYASSRPLVLSGQLPELYTHPLEVLPFTLTRTQRDSTPPDVDVDVSGPLGTGGWYTGATTVDWTVGDAQSPVTTDGCEDLDLLADQPVTTYACTATSAGGVTGPVEVSVGVDATPPTVTCDAAPVFDLGQAPAVVGATVADAGSGPAASRVSAPVSTATAGARTVTLVGSDVAGLLTTVACDYTVQGYAWEGFFAPVRPGENVVKAGRAVPLKWRVLDAAGRPVTTLTSVDLTVSSSPCGLGATPDLAQEAAAGASGLQNLGNGYYQLNWRTPAAYARSCKQLHLDVGDGIDHTARFRFTR